MVTKLKNISYSSGIKAIMFVLLVAIVMVCSKGIAKIANISDYKYNSEYALDKYSEEYGVDYYEEYNSVVSALTTYVSSLDDLYKIYEDNGEHSVDDIMNIDIDDYINNGIRYVLVNQDTGKIIGTDGITSMDTNYLDWYNDITCDKYYIVVHDYLGNYTEEEINKFKPILDRDSYSMGDDYAQIYSNVYLLIKYDDSIDQDVQNYVDKKLDSIETDSVKTLICGALGFLILIYFFLVGGQKEKNAKVEYLFFDKIATDVLLVIYCCVIFMGFVISAILLNDYSGHDFRQYSNLVAFLFALFTSIATVGTVSNLSKKIKNNDFWNSCLVIKIVKYIYNKIYFYTKVKTSLMLKFALVGSIISFFIILGEPYFAVFIVPIFVLIVMSMMKLVDGIDKLKNNENFSYDKKLRHIVFNEAFESLEEINCNMDKNYKEGVKAQSLKAELITNVSHDLRTPLTSIIGYIDLLDKKSELYDEETKEYISVLRDKSDRMNDMVEDLFDLAKSASGDIELEFEKLNLKKLIEQTLVELDDISENNNIVVNIADDLNINADGSKMYRVMQNIISNALKYSLNGTRIYIESYVDENNKITLEIKNIANYKMNFTSNDIVERFVRGDESRTTEGSGIGLSIAKSYTTLNGGIFNVVIDGDMFKVQMKFMNI